MRGHLVVMVLYTWSNTVVYGLKMLGKVYFAGTNSLCPLCRYFRYSKWPEFATKTSLPWCVPEWRRVFQSIIIGGCEGVCEKNPEWGVEHSQLRWMVPLQQMTWRPLLKVLALNRRNYFGMSGEVSVLHSVLPRTWRTYSTPPRRPNIWYNKGTSLHTMVGEAPKVVLYNRHGHFAFCRLWRARLNLKKSVIWRWNDGLGSSTPRRFGQCMIVGYFYCALLYAKLCSQQHTTLIYEEWFLDVSRETFQKWASHFLEKVLERMNVEHDV